MKEHEIVSAVEKTTGLGDPAHTEQAVRATVRVLGERLAGGETRHLASQLPDPLARELPPQGEGERFGMDEFYRRVAREEGQGCTASQARQHSRAVMTALRGSLTGHEFDDLATQLPKEYDDLLSLGPVH